MSRLQQQHFAQQLQDQIKLQRESRLAEKKQETECDQKMYQRLQEMARERDEYLQNLLKCYKCNKSIQDYGYAQVSPSKN